MNDNQNFWNAINLLNIYSVYLGLENLYENRAQSEHNDVQTANDKQAQYILEEINRRFEEQNVILEHLMSDVAAIKNANNLLIEKRKADK